MKHILIALLFMQVLLLNAQEIGSASISTSARDINPADTVVSSYQKREVIALYDNDPSRWTQEGFVDELYWLKEGFESEVYVPKLYSSKSQDEIENHLKISESAGKLVYFFCHGTGCDYASELMRRGIGGVMVSPTSSIEAVEVELETAIFVSQTRQEDSSNSIVDTLVHAGYWANHESSIDQDYFFVEDYRNKYLKQMNWVDSIQGTVRDSSFSKRQGVQSIVPEVIKQGKSLVLDLLILEEGDYTVSVINLSAQQVFQKEVYYGKGNQRMVIPTRNFAWGVYKIEISGKAYIERHKTMIRG